MRLFFTVCYCILLTILVVIYAARDHSQPITAVGQLARNHLLRAQDLQPQGGSAELLVGRYLRVAVSAKAVITASDTLQVPSLEAAPGKLLLLLPVERAHVTDGSIDAESPVQLCADKKPVVGPSTVKPKAKAVVCGATGSALCMVATEFDSTDAVTIASAAASAPSVRPATGKCG